jgi:ABC-2 type transport system permease protein
MSPYASAFLLQVQTGLRYRLNTLFFLPIFVVPALAAFFLWTAVLGPSGQLGSYDLSSMVTYYLVTHFFVSNTPFSAWTEIGESIRDGTLARWLTRPAGHYGLFLARNLGTWVLYWLMGIGGVVALGLLLRPHFRFQPDPYLVLAALSLWLGGVVLGFTWGYLLQLTAFWTERVRGSLGVVEQVVSFLAGALAPLDLLPLSGLWQWLPFRFAGYVPAQIYLGRMSEREIGAEAAILLGWMLAFAVLVQVVWQRGLRRFQGAGG